MMRSRFWVVGIAILVASAALAEEPFRPRKYQPPDWLAFVSSGLGYTRNVVNALNATPEVIIYRDGRIIWRREARDRIGCNTDPERWRKAQLAPRQLERLTRLAEQSGFLDLRPELPQSQRPTLSDDTVTTVGIAAPGGRKRVADAYDLDFCSSSPTADALTRASAEVANAILRLRPKESHRLVPSAIRVALAGPSVDIPFQGRAALWPLALAPETPSRCLQYYEGADATALMREHVGTNLTRIGEADYWIGWAPAISTPETTVLTGTISGFGEHPEPSSGSRSPTKPLPAPVRTLTGHRDYVAALAWHPDSQYLATGAASRDDQPRVWDVGGGKLVQTLHWFGTQRLAWTPDGMRLGIGSNYRLILWRRGDPIGALIEHHDPWTNGVAFSPDGRRIAFGYDLQVVDRATGKTVWKKNTGRSWGRDVAWSPDGKLIATSDRAGALQLFDARNGKEVRMLGHPAEPRDRHLLHRPIAWEPAGKRVAVPDERASVIRIWNSETGEEQPALPYAGAEPNALSWSTNRRYLAATGGTTLHVYDLRTGHHRTFGGNTNLYAGAWSPDNRRFAAGTSDRTVLIWDGMLLRKGL